MSVAHLSPRNILKTVLSGNSNETSLKQFKAKIQTIKEVAAFIKHVLFRSLRIHCHSCHTQHCPYFLLNIKSQFKIAFYYKLFRNRGSHFID